MKLKENKMLSFLTFVDFPEEVEIIADEEGIDLLIDYLEEIKKTKDHVHLIDGAETDLYPIEKYRITKVFSTKHVRLQYSETDDWKK